MAIAILEIVALLCVLILPLFGPSKKRERRVIRPDEPIERSNFAINESGQIEEILTKEDKK